MTVPESLLHKRILVVDDFLEMRELYRDILSYHGFQVAMAENGEKAIQQYREEPFDLVILDLFLPDMNGLDVITNLIIDFPEIKIIAISGGDIEHQKELDHFLASAHFTGAKKSLQKPCDPELFLTTVVGVLLDNGN